MRFRAFLIVFVSVTALIAVMGGLIFRFSPQSFGLTPNDGSTNKGLLDSLFFYKTEQATVAPLNGVGDPPPPRESFLTGLPVKDPEEERFLAVMIDEAPQARPHFRGLDQAGVIFEMPAEGGVPRIMAIVSDYANVEEIGPVRSARDYFVSIAEGIAGGYVHAGGSPQALQMLATSAMRNIDENANDPRFRRDTTIARPHNLFVKPAEAFTPITHRPLTSKLFPFSEALPEVADAIIATRIDVDFSTRRHAVAWNYDAENDCYRRIQEVETAALCPTNVIVAVTGVWLLEGDEKGRLGVRTTGNGKATVFRGSKAFPATWARESKGRFTFADTTGAVIPLRPGQTFVQIVDNPQRYAFSAPSS